jgi:predicted aminopeptidase
MGSILGVLLLGGTGCTTLGWYGQAMRGQLELMTQREDIETRLAAPGGDPVEQRKLALALEARVFAHDHLALPDNGSYLRYVDLDREAVLWNVVAAPEFSLEPRLWCYPLVGCLAYRGWFRLDAAEREAVRLRQRGYDVRVAPVAAYSTLGRFKDPVTKPMLAWPQPELAGLIFHELAHQRLFVAGDTVFSEAYATAVERAGVEAFLVARGDRAAFDAWQARQRLRAERSALMLTFRDRLVALYAGGAGPDLLRAEKRRLLDCLARRVERLQPASVPRGGFNNADLALAFTYESGTRALLDLLAEYEGDFGQFHEAAERIASAGPVARAEFLNP